MKYIQAFVLTLIMSIPMFMLKYGNETWAFVLLGVLCAIISEIYGAKK